jgi:hypothetical protein
LGNFRCLRCQSNTYQRHLRSGECVESYSDGCHQQVGKVRDAGRYGEYYVTVDGPPPPEGVKESRTEDEQGTSYHYEECLCLCHLEKCGAEDWMRACVWIKASIYDSEC